METSDPLQFQVTEWLSLFSPEFVQHHSGKYHRCDFEEIENTANSYWNLLPGAGINELFRSEHDNAYNYGAFSSTITHGITHLFDRTGRTIDEQCRQRNWWTADDLTQYDKLTASLGNYFDLLGSRYDIEHPPFKGRLHRRTMSADCQCAEVAGGLMQLCLNGTH